MSGSDYERLDWMCQCQPVESCTPRSNLTLLAAWAKDNPGQVPTCAKCGRPFDLRNSIVALMRTEAHSGESHA